MEIHTKVINNRLFVDTFTMYKSCVDNPCHYKRWIKSWVLRVGRIGKELIVKGENRTSEYIMNKRHRYWAHVDFAIYLCRIMDTNLSKKVEELLEAEKLSSDPETDDSFDVET